MTRCGGEVEAVRGSRHMLQPIPEGVFGICCAPLSPAWVPRVNRLIQACLQFRRVRDRVTAFDVEGLIDLRFPHNGPGRTGSGLLLRYERA